MPGPQKARPGTDSSTMGTACSATFRLRAGMSESWYLKAFGVFQILIALIILSLGLVMLYAWLLFDEPVPSSVHTRYPIWGSVTFIFSGFINIAGGFDDSNSMATFVALLYIISLITSFIGIMISAVNLNNFPFEHTPCEDSPMPEICDMNRSMLMMQYGGKTLNQEVYHGIRELAY